MGQSLFFSGSPLQNGTPRSISHFGHLRTTCRHNAHDLRRQGPASGICYVNKSCGGRVPICRFVLWFSGSLHSDSVFRSAASRRLSGRSRRTAASGAVTTVLRGWSLSLQTSPLASPSARHRAAENLSRPVSPIFPEKECQLLRRSRTAAEDTPEPSRRTPVARSLRK